MTVEITNPEAIAEVEEFMARFKLSAKDVVETVLIETGGWMPMETLGYMAEKKIAGEQPVDSSHKVPSVPSF
jgi:hypothetical protein